MKQTIASLIAVTIVAGAAAAVINAQTPPPTTPGPEHKKLEYFVGKWTTTGEMKASPFGPAGKITATDNCEWFQGGFAVVCTSQGTMPAGPSKSMAIMGYSTDHKMYTYYGVDNTAMSMATVPMGTIQNNVWTFNDSGTMGGQPYKARFILKIVSPTSYTFSWEMQGADQKWMTTLEGTSTKAR